MNVNMTIFKKMNNQDIAYSNVYHTRTESFYLITDIRFYKKKKLRWDNKPLFNRNLRVSIDCSPNEYKKLVALNVFIYIFTILMVLY